MSDEMRNRVKAFLVERDKAHGFVADFVGDAQQAADADAMLLARKRETEE